MIVFGSIQTELGNKDSQAQSDRNVGPVERNGTIGLASYWKRFGAALIDYFVAIVPFYLLTSKPYNEFLVGLLLIIVFWPVQAAILSISGQSIGKKIFKTRIVRISDGNSGGFISNYLVRSLLNTFLSLTVVYLIVDITFILRSDRRCLHDLMAGTVVVDVNKP
jgi:uncharacterized RDD family membrane protein YckC